MRTSVGKGVRKPLSMMGTDKKNKNLSGKRERIHGKGA